MSEPSAFADIFHHMHSQLKPDYVQVLNAVNIRCLQRNVSREDAVAALVYVQQDLECRGRLDSYMEHVDK